MRLWYHVKSKGRNVEKISNSLNLLGDPEPNVDGNFVHGVTERDWGTDNKIEEVKKTEERLDEFTEIVSVYEEKPQIIQLESKKTKQARHKVRRTYKGDVEQSEPCVVVCEDQSGIRDYKKRVWVDDVTKPIVIDVQIPRDERIQCENIILDNFVSNFFREIRVVDEFTDPEFWSSTAIFHEKYGLGFISIDGEWNENTTITDFMRYIAGLDSDWREI